MAHGVFDVVHIGHIEYFKEAKKLSDILIVSITADKFVNKGLNRPFFKEKDRIEFLDSLKMIDHVIVNENYDASKIINLIKPNYYIKGPDYKKDSGDTHGNLGKEKKAVISHGGKIYFTSGKQYSSSRLINEKLDFLSGIQKKHLDKFKNVNTKLTFHENFNRTLSKIKKNKILIIGEIIIDNYRYVKPLSRPSKENILSSEFVKNESFLGGAVPILKNICEMNDNVTFVSIHNDKKIINALKKNLKNKVKLKVFRNRKFVDIEKSRYVNIKTFSKMFEIYKFVNKNIFDKALMSFLKKNISSYDHVVVCDFGHGLINQEIIKILSKAKYISANIQTNAGNRGYNLFTKYKKLDFLSIDEPELRLGLVDKESDLEVLLKKIQNKYKNILLTRGVDGLTYKAYKKKSVYFPALTTKPRDTIGAGDAAYSYASCFIKNNNDRYLVSLVAAIAGALKVDIIGHRDFVEKNNVYKTLIYLTKK